MDNEKQAHPPNNPEGQTPATTELPPKPIPIPVLAENIPQTLKDPNQWVNWRYELSDKVKWTKPPYQPNGYYAKTNDPSTWSTFDAVLEAYQTGKFDGIGYCFSESDNTSGVDLDHCYHNGVDRLALEYVEHFQDKAYIELSPSGEGLRLFTKGKAKHSGKKGWIEVYTHPSSRYLTITGHVLTEYSAPIGDGQDALDWLHETTFAEKKAEPKPEPKPKPETATPPPTFSCGLTDDQVLEKAYGAKNSAKFTELWNGPVSGDHSKDDAALCSMLAFWTQDEGQIDRLFRTSGLMRPKWEQPYKDGSTYGQRTIRKALAGLTATYQPDHYDGKQTMTTEGKEEKDADLSPGSWADLDELDDIQWHWPNWIPTGFLIMLAGVSGCSKSALALRISQTYIQGLPWPDGTPYTGETGKVLWCEAEAAQYLNKTRARDWDIPKDQILTPISAKCELSFSDADHRLAIQNGATRPDVRLIVLDSLYGIYGGEENDSKFGKVSKWFADLAKATQKPVLVIHHVRKSETATANISLSDVRGHSSVVQSCRVVLGIDTPNLADTSQKRVKQLKNNLAILAEPIGFRWQEDKIVFGSAPVPIHAETRIDVAKEALLAFLSKRPQPVHQILDYMESLGITKTTTRRAKKELGLVLVRNPGQQHQWSLPYEEIT